MYTLFERAFLEIIDRGHDCGGRLHNLELPENLGIQVEVLPENIPLLKKTSNYDILQFKNLTNPQGASPVVPPAGTS